MNLKELRELGTFVIWVVGGPGIGKTTLCSRLARDFSLVHISISELLHDLISDNPVEGYDEISTMKKGQIVPAEFILFVLKQEMAKNMAQKPKGFLLDGFPMDLAQGTRFENEVAPVDCILYLLADNDTLIERIFYRSKLTKGSALEDPKIVYAKLKSFRDFEKPFNEYYVTQIRDINAIGEPIAVYRKCAMIINDVIIKHYALKVLIHNNAIN
ncbi:adenylate kinase isoenzyme 1-like isoform X2 [Planococcus citri]